MMGPTTSVARKRRATPVIVVYRLRMALKKALRFIQRSLGKSAFRQPGAAVCSAAATDLHRLVRLILRGELACMLLQFRGMWSKIIR